MQARQTVAFLVASLGLGGLAARASDETADRFKAGLLSTPMGTEIRATLASGETVQGELAEAGGESFGLWLEPDESTRKRLRLTSGRVKKKIRYEDVKELSGARQLAISSEELRFRLRAGDSIRVRTADGDETRGRVEAYDGDHLRVEARSFRLSDGEVQRIEMKVDDSLVNGALIGLGIGAGWVGLGCAVQDYCEPSAGLVAALIVGGGGAGLGALIDAASTGSEVVYLSPNVPSKQLSVAPLLTRDKKGIFVRISF